MIYDSKKEYDRKKMKDRIIKLVNNNKVIEVKEVRNKRTLQQNKYLHVLCTFFGIDTGFTIEEVKFLIKTNMSSMFMYQRSGEKFYRSTADLDTKEMTDVIHWFKDFAEIHGIKLPDAQWCAENYASLQAEYSRHEMYLTKSMTA